MANTNKCCECITLAGVITFGFQERSNQLGRIRNETFGVLEDRGHGEDGVLSDVCVSMLEAGAGRGEEGFNELGFAQLAQES